MTDFKIQRVRIFLPKNEKKTDQARIMGHPVEARRQFFIFIQRIKCIQVRITRTLLENPRIGC